MPTLFHRLFRIVRSSLPPADEILERISDKWREPSRDFENSDEGTGDSGGSASFGGGPGEDASGSFRHQNADAAYPQQVVDDLTVFNLSPPSSLEEVRRARNREIKKYHSDRFVNDPEKFATSKEIMQIYNAAYDRLKTHYGK